jgi:hypothetical protein
MEILGIFAVACVSDMERSVEWYARLIGRAPDDRPMEGLVQWRSSNGAGLQLVVGHGKSDVYCLPGSGDCLGGSHAEDLRGQLD